MRVAITGGRGQLARDLELVLTERGHAVRSYGHRDWDITDPAATRRVMEALQPEVVINTAAYHRVDEIEDEAERAFLVNGSAVLDLARQTTAHGARLVHFSTDYVFDGEAGRPYTENDRPRPLSVYGASKLLGEYLALQGNASSLVVRSSGLYGVRGTSGHEEPAQLTRRARPADTKSPRGGKVGGNFVETMLRLASEGRAFRVVNDQTLSPTYTGHLARYVAHLVEAAPEGGLYHATASGAVSFFDFARAIFEHEGLLPDVRPQTSAESGAKARRPRFSALVSVRGEALGLAALPDWQEGLAEYFRARRAQAVSFPDQWHGT